MRIIRFRVIILLITAPVLGFYFVMPTPTNHPVTQEKLELFKQLHSDDPQIQALTLESINQGGSIGNTDWILLFREQSQAAVSPTGGQSSQISDCEKAVAKVVYDVICLVVGGAGLIRSVEDSVLEGIFDAVQPAESQIKEILATMGKPGATTAELAMGSFQIAKALYTVNKDALIAAFSANLTWYEKILYAVTAAATLAALVLTDGTAFIAEVILLATAVGFLAEDANYAFRTCTMVQPNVYSDGTRIRDDSNGMIYMVVDGGLSWIPDELTYQGLYGPLIGDWTSLPSVAGLMLGPAITQGASLVKADSRIDPNVYLLQASGLRYINSEMFGKFGFKWELIKPIPPANLANIPLGAPLG